MQVCAELNGSYPRKIYGNIDTQEAMENFAFPTEITTKLMKIEIGKLIKHEMAENK